MGSHLGWSTGLLGSCLMEPVQSVYCLGCCCCGLGYTYGLTQEMMSGGKRGRWSECCFYTLSCCFLSSTCVGWSNRWRMRKLMHVKGSMCGDWVAHCLCQPCAIVQEYRSVRLQEWRMSENVWSNMGVEHMAVGTLTVDGQVNARNTMDREDLKKKHLMSIDGTPRSTMDREDLKKTQLRAIDETPSG